MVIGGMQRSGAAEGAASPAREQPGPASVAWLAAIPVAVLGVALGWLLGPPLGRLLFSVNLHSYLFLPAISSGPPPAPEPTQHARYVIALAVPALFGLALLRVRARPLRLSPRLVTVLIVVAQVLGIAFAALTFYKQRGVWAHWGLTGETYFPSWGLVAAVVFAAVVVGLSVRGFNLPSWLTTRPRRRWDIVIGGVAILAALLWLLPDVFRDQNFIRANNQVQYNYMFTADDFLSVADGRTPLVNYIGQYTQLLPFLVAPILGLFHYTVGAFTSVMTILTVAAFACLYGVLRRVTGDARIALALYVPVVAVSVEPQLIEGAQRLSLGADFNLYPIRYLGPFVLAWLCARYLDGARPHGRFWLFAIGGLVAVNNVDFGIPALGAAYVALWVAGGPEGLVRRTLELTRDLVLGVLAALAAVSVLTLLRAGSFPHFGYAFYFARLFGIIGIGSLPMPLLGFQWIIYMTFVAALITAVVRARRGAPGVTLTGMLAFSAIFGLGAAAYYANRSHPDVLMALFAPWGLSVSLLAWVAIRAFWNTARHDALQQRMRMVLPTGAALLCLGLTASTIGGFPPPWTQISRIKSNTVGEVDITVGAAQFVKTHSHPGEHVLLLLDLGHNVARQAGVINVMPFNSPITMVLGQQLRVAVNFLRAEHGVRIFGVTASTTNPLNVLSPVMVALIQQLGYVPVATDPVSQLTEWLPRGHVAR